MTLYEQTRSRMAQLVEDKRAVECEIDDTWPCMLGLGAHRVMRAGSRHYHERELISILQNRFTDILREAGMSEESSAIRWRLENGIINWMRLHYEYEAVVRQLPVLYDEVKLDRFLRAMEDAKNWPE